MIKTFLAAMLAAGSPQVAIELDPEVGVSATGEQITTYDYRLAEAVVGSLLGHGITAGIVSAGERQAGSRLAIRLNHHAIPGEWLKKGHGPAFYGFALGIGQSNPDGDTTISCTRMVGTALRQAGEVPSLYRSFKLPGLDQPILDGALGIHFAKGDATLVGRTGAAMALEIGIVSHPDDARRLSSPVVVAGLADAIAAGITECFDPTEEAAEDNEQFLDPEMFK